MEMSSPPSSECIYYSPVASISFRRWTRERERGRERKEKEEEEADSSQCLRSRAAIVPAGSRGEGGGDAVCDGGKAEPSSSLKFPGQIFVISGNKKQEDIDGDLRFFNPNLLSNVPPLRWHVSCLCVTLVPPVSSCQRLHCHGWISNTTHRMRSPPRPPRSRSLSPRRISMTTKHTCWWIPHSRISPGDTSVCLWDSIKENINGTFNGRRHKKPSLKQRWS